MTTSNYITIKYLQVMRKELIKAGQIDYIIDIRTVEEWNKGHHPNAIHIPMGTFPENINKKVEF